MRYQRGKFLNAMGAHSAEENEQNIVTVEGEGRTVIFKQIAGLIARRIVFNFRVGDHVARGQRVGLIKFGSRVDVLFDRDAAIQVKTRRSRQGRSDGACSVAGQRSRFSRSQSIAASRTGRSSSARRSMNAT